ncbi:hypothetical protein CYL20_11635 [Pseudomonas palleroniana]|uniref:Histidine kinase n=1 Tax=Pseudomonas palleroniana TaxID=191390 RepID=A0A2L1J9I8_9PSED|nr:hypothetical protein [Pseudomonas palleroniana]AVE05164.1 hypothetical protein CYL20_11635 [Pseudomonas palleroniana]
MSRNNIQQLQGTEAWYSLLQDRAALLANPGAHHSVLITEARKLYSGNTIDRDELSDMLEQADGALSYAVEALLDGHESD